MTTTRRTLPAAATAALLVVACFSAHPAQAQIVITSPASTPSGVYAGVFTAQAGQSLVFSGRINNAGSDTLFDAQVFFKTTKSPGDFSFIGKTYSVGVARQTGVLTLGTLNISRVTPVGNYVFFLDAEGTDSAGDPSNIPSDNYLLTIAPAPEPTPLAALGVGFLGLGALALCARRRAASL